MMSASQRTFNHPWSARGLLFENCSCTLVCPGHVHFSQRCTRERCRGYWAMRFDEGSLGEVSLAGAKALVVFDSPQRMIDGQWIEGLIIDEAASSEQRQALDSILRGHAGGPWEKLAGFVAERLPTRYLPIDMIDEPEHKRASIPRLFDTVVKQIRGRNTSAPVTFENIFNQIHAPSQVLALVDTAYDDGRIVIHNSGTHGLWSCFEWEVAGTAGERGTS
jgi:hypothetical protein